MEEERTVEEAAAQAEAFKLRFLVVSTSVIGLTSLVMVIYAVTQLAHAAVVTALLGALAVVITCGVLALRGRLALSSKIFSYGLFGCMTVPLLLGQPLLRGQPLLPPFTYAFVLMLVIGAFLLQPRVVLIQGGIGVLSLIIGAVVSGQLGGQDIESLVLASAPVLLISGALFLTSQQVERLLGRLEARARSNEELNREVLIVASHLGAATGEIHAMMQEQTAAAVSQSSAVEETRHVLRSVSDASQDIVSATQSALSNAQTTFRNSERVAGHVEILSRHTQDIVGILGNIREIADKSDLLALNAALEGTRAGEVGRGFSLVANQMQRLAESIASSVRDVQELTDNIRQATDTTQLSMEEAMKLAHATIEAAQRINLVIQQQQSGVSQVTTAMDDIVELTAQVAAGTNQTIASTSDLQDLAEKLMSLVRSFREQVPSS